jgi:hypothetical protein
VLTKDNGNLIKINIDRFGPKQNCSNLDSDSNNCRAQYDIGLEVLYIGEQLRECGPAVYSNMYKYERCNKYLKNIIKNRRAPISSLVKNYLVAELSTMHLGINVDDIQKMVEIFKYADIGISSDVIAGLNGLSKLIYDQSSNQIIYCEKLPLESLIDDTLTSPLKFPNPSLAMFACEVNKV